MAAASGVACGEVVPNCSASVRIAQSAQVDGEDKPDVTTNDHIEAGLVVRFGKLSQ